MESLEGEGFSEATIRVKTPRSYWIPTLWLASLILVGAGGYLTAGAEMPPGLLATVREAWTNIFAGDREGFVEIIDTNQPTPQALILEEPDRVFVKNVGETILPAVASVNIDQAFCDLDTEDVPLRNRVIINEIAWMGGLESEGLDARDEWIELKNISSSTVDIGGWQINDDDGQINFVFPDSTLLISGGFILLERTDDGSVPQTAADFFYNGSLANEDDGLRLFSSLCQLEDEVLADPSWPAGNALQRRTMERDSDINWHTFGGSLTGAVLGTPKAENSEPAEIIEQEEVGEEKDNCSLEDLNIPTHKVLINEVAWSGKNGDTSEEWIELYYQDKTGMNLAGWQLLDGEASIAVHFGEEDIIDGYLLIRRILASEDPGADYYVGEKRADKTYTGVIQNSNESLYLFDADCTLVDEVIDVGTNWKNIGGTASPDYRTAERTSDDKWHTYSGSGRSDVMGTPRAVNSKAADVHKSSASSSGGGGSSQGPSGDEISWCPQDALGPPTHTVLINEIAWAGTASSTSEEWTELYSPAVEGISLSGWQLLDRDGEIKVSFSEGEHIDNYLLLRRILAEDDPEASYAVAGVTADKTYAGVLQNDDETLRLFDASCNLVDEVADVGADWINIGGTASPDYRTAERISENSWKTYEGNGLNGVMGTPRAENSPAGGEENPPDDEGPPDDGENPPDGEDPPTGGGADLADLTITEIIFDVEGTDDGQERVKISNGGDADIAIEMLSLQYLRTGGELSTIKKKNFESGDSILAGGNFIVGMSCSTAVPCEGVDMSWSQALANDGGTVYLVSNQENITDVSDPDIIHFLAYAPVVPGG